MMKVLIGILAAASFAIAISTALKAGDSLSDSLIFYAPLDGSVEAQIAAGAKTPLSPDGLKFVEGKFGKAVELAGKARLYYAGDKNINISSGTIAFWGKRHESWASSKTFMLFRGFAEGEWNQNAFFLQVAKWNALRAWIFDESKKEYSTAADVNGLQAEQWVHIACTFKDGSVRLFIDGKEASPYQTPCNPMLVMPNVSPKELRFGSDYDERLVFNGVMDELRIYNRPLTPEEIKSVHETAPVK